MAEENVRRYSDKDPISMGTESINISGNDIIPLQHTTGDNKDKSLKVNYIQAIPVGTTDTASATATKVVTLVNYPNDYPIVIGTKILVTFTNGNTATAQMYLTIGTETKPATCKGFALKSPIPEGSQIEFTYTGTSFNCQDFAISSIDTSSLQPVNSSAVNGALANCQKVKYLEINGNTEDEFITNLINRVWDNYNENETIFLKGAWAGHFFYIATGYKYPNLNLVVNFANATYQCYKSGEYVFYYRLTTTNDLANLQNPISKNYLNDNVNDIFPLDDKELTFINIASETNNLPTKDNAHYLVRISKDYVISTLSAFYEECEKLVGQQGDTGYKYQRWGWVDTNGIVWKEWQRITTTSDLETKADKQHAVAESYQSFFDKYTGGGNVVFAVVTNGYDCGFYALYEHGGVYPIKLLCGSDMSVYGSFSQSDGRWIFTSKINWTAVKFFY